MLGAIIDKKEEVGLVRAAVVPLLLGSAYLFRAACPKLGQCTHLGKRLTSLDSIVRLFYSTQDCIQGRAALPSAGCP